MKVIFVKGAWAVSEIIAEILCNVWSDMDQN